MRAQTVWDTFQNGSNQDESDGQNPDPMFTTSQIPSPLDGLPHGRIRVPAVEPSPDSVVAASHFEMPGGYSTENFDNSVSPWARVSSDCDYSWQLMPDGLMYKSYLAGEKEPRMQAVWLYEKDRGWIWETALGGRVGLVRYGTTGAVRPQGWQIDIEGAAFPRIDPDIRSEMDAVDFRIGSILTRRRGPTSIKAGYYHISSHIGDEYLLRNPGFNRIEYVRDALIFGVHQYLNSDLAIYGEVGYAIGHVGGAEPLEFQFGMEYSPAVANGLQGSPCAGINGHLRQDFDYGGNINIVAGWQWRSAESDRVFRIGCQYFNGMSLQYQFFDKREDLLGLGMWFDF